MWEEAVEEPVENGRSDEGVDVADGETAETLLARCTGAKRNASSMEERSRTYSRCPPSETLVVP